MNGALCFSEKVRFEFHIGLHAFHIFNTFFFFALIGIFELGQACGGIPFPTESGESAGGAFRAKFQTLRFGVFNQHVHS